MHINFVVKVFLDHLYPKRRERRDEAHPKQQKSSAVEPQSSEDTNKKQLYSKHHNNIVKDIRTGVINPGELSQQFDIYE